MIIDPQLIGTAASLLLFLVAGALMVVAYSSDGRPLRYPWTFRIVAVVLFGMTILNLYSATAYLWTEHYPDILALTRLLTVSLRTLLLILLVGLLLYYVRVVRRS